jgi:parvulin-like peptidyl-prolyl isomerase
MSLNSFRTGFQKILGSKLGYIVVFIIGGLLVFSFVYSGLGNNIRAGGGAPSQGAQSETIATVNGDPITRGDFQDRIDYYQQEATAMNQSIGPLRTAELHAQALDDLITAKLELGAAEKLGLKASDTEIEKARMQMVAHSSVAQELGLKPTASLTEIDNALSQNGQPPIESRLPNEALRQQVLLDKLQTYESNKIVVTEQDARDSFQQYHTRHILISNKSRSDVQAQSQAQQILAKAKAPGADFAALAKQYSEDPGTKNSGGDDGWIDQSTGYVPEFKQAAFALKPGQVTLVKSPQYGYFIIKLVAVRSNLPKDFSKNPAKYIDQVKQQKQQQAMQDFITGLKNAPANKIVVSDAQLRGDRTLVEASQDSDPAKQQADFRSAVADYQQALKAKPLAETAAEIQVATAQAYQGLHQTPQAIAAFQAALQTTDDPDLRMELGNLYLQSKQTGKAVEQFQQASKQAWDNQPLHQQLMMTYLQMKRPDLVAKEQDWLKKYQDRQKQMQATAPAGLPSGNIVMPAAPSPSGSATSSAPQSVQVVPSPAPGAATVVPTSGNPSAPIKKPTQ